METAMTLGEPFSGRSVGTESVPRASELRELSPKARGWVDALSSMADRMTGDERLGGAAITRPHPLILMVRRGPYASLMVPAVVWDKGRDLLAPYADKIALAEARVLVLGRPQAPDLSQALNLGLTAILPEEPSTDEML